MNKLKQTILMLCFILSGALCHANDVARTEKEGDGVTVDVIEYSGCTEPSRGHSIIPTINGHVLSVTFTENMGQVSVEVATAAGASVQCLSVFTPNGLQVYIPNAGDYIVTFTLPNGDVYAGEFTVTD